MEIFARHPATDRQARRPWLLISVSLFLLASIVLGQLRPTPALAAPLLKPTAQSFTVAIPTDVTGFDPALATDNTTWLVSGQVLETLVNVQPGGSLPVPGLASSWTTSTDGLTWTFTLKPGIKFQDSTNLDAAAVVFNLQRWWDPANTYHTGSFETFANYFGGFKGDANCLLSGVTIPANDQVQLTLTQPMGNLLNVLAMPAFAIGSPVWFISTSNAPVGSGPFSFSISTPGDNIQLVPNSLYAGTPAQPNPLIFKIIPLEDDRVAALHDGTVDAISDVSPNIAAGLRSDPFMKVQYRSSVNLGYLGINRAHTPFGDIKVRQAIAHAINKQHLLATTYLAGDQAAGQFLPPSIWGYKPGLDTSYDPALAMTLLSQAGFPNGFTTTLSFRDVYRTYLPNPLAAAQDIQADLAAVNITATITQYDPATMITKEAAGELDLFLLGWVSDYQHPDDFFAPHFCNPGNLGFGALDTQFCSDIAAAWNEPSLTAQLADYQAASQHIFDTIPAVPLANPRSAFATRYNVTGLAAAASGLESYQNVSFNSAAPAPQHTLKVALSADITGLDPALIQDQTTWMVTSQMLDTLINYQDGGSLPVAGLASDWTQSTDGLTWTFTLRPGLKFQDSTNLDADAVVFNLNRWWDPANAYHNGSFDYFSSLFGGFKGDAGCLLTSIDIPAAGQVRLHLSKRMSILPTVLAMPMFAIASPAALKAGTFGAHPVGSGPYQFVDWAAGNHVELVANPSYWGTAAKIKTLTFTVIPNENTRISALHNGTVDVLNDLSNAPAATIQNDPFSRIQWRPSGNVGYLGITRSPAHAPLDNLLVRQAIAHAINKQHLISSAYLPGYQAAGQFLPPVIWGFKPGLDTSYDPTLAKSLLTQAGYPNGFTTTLSYRTASRAYLPYPAAAAQAIAADLAAVKITATLQELESSDMLTKVYAGQLDLYLLGWGADYYHPDDFFSYHFCNPTNLQFGAMDNQSCTYLQTAWNEPLLANQVTDYQAESQYIFDTLPAVPLVYGRFAIAARYNIAGLVAAPLSNEAYKNVYFTTSFWVPAVKR